MKTANIEEEYIPEVEDPEIFKYLPVEDDFVIKNFVSRTDTADISPVNSSSNNSFEFHIKPDQNYLINLDKSKLFISFDMQLVNDLGVAQNITAATPAWSDAKAKFADGWANKLMSTIKLYFFNQTVEECRYPYYKAALNTAMKFSKSDYNRGLYKTMGYGQKVGDSNFDVTDDVVGTPGKVRANLCFRLKDILESCNSIQQMTYQLFMKFQINTIPGSRVLGITADGTNRWVAVGDIDIKLTVPSKVPNNQLEAAVLNAYKGTPQLSYELFSEDLYTQTMTSAIQTHTLNQPTFIKNKLLMLMFFRDKPETKEGAAASSFINASTPGEIERIEVSNQGTVKYYEKTFTNGNYLELYQDYLDSKDYFESIDETAITYEEYLTKYFIVCIPLEDFEMPKKDSNIKVKIWYARAAGVVNNHMYAVFLGDTLGKIDIRKHHFVATNN